MWPAILEMMLIVVRPQWTVWVTQNQILFSVVVKIKIKIKKVNWTLQCWHTLSRTHHKYHLVNRLRECVPRQLTLWGIWNLKTSHLFLKTQQTANAQITQMLKSKSAQYMGKCMKDLLWPQKFSNPNCTLCQSNNKGTWPHLLLLCSHKFLKGQRITIHNAATQRINSLLKSCTNTRHYTLTNAGNKEDHLQDNTIPQ